MNKCGLIIVGLFFSINIFGEKETPALQVIERTLEQDNLPVKIKIRKQKGETYFQHEAKDGVLQITASDQVAACRGFYDYIKQHKGGMFTWSGSSMKPLAELEDSPLRQIVSPFQDHYYFNVCTYGYSMPYWDWQRWEREIDWMALHGINMPLSLVGYEAIMARVWKKMGLTDDEINAYFVGPAHLPWMRMGNVSGIDGPLNEDWHKQQIALQHKILERMRSLDMKPICPGFAGFIPEAFKRIHPELHILKTHWGGAFHNWMISPQEPLFTEISVAFIKEWEKEFGACDYYLIDSFNEMDIPFPAKGSAERYELVASYGEKVYQAIRKANPKAIWAMQGWMFGYQRNIWDYETLGALVSRVPDDKMLLLDLAVDYNKHFWHSEVNWEFYKGFYHKPWVYSVIPNMGGKTGMTGVLDFYANGHLEALRSPNKGRLQAHGLAPEGIENNEVLYELVTDAGWSDTTIVVSDWIEHYSQNRYGQTTSELTTAWKHLLSSVYGTFTDHPRYNWQFRPGTVKNGSILISDDFFKGLEHFVAAAQELPKTELMKNDVAEMATHYLGGKCEILTKQIDQAFLLGDTLQARWLQSRFETLMLGMDVLLSNHTTLRLERWLDFARKAAVTPEQEAQYLTNARRIVTIWGPPVDDYSARVWSGLIRNYYLPRWKYYYEVRNSGSATLVDLAAWERSWVEQNTDTQQEPAAVDVYAFAQKMIALSKDIKAMDLLSEKAGMIGFWNVNSAGEKSFTFHLSAAQLKMLKLIRLEVLKGKTDNVSFEGFVIEADGKVIASSEQPKAFSKGQCLCPVVLPEQLNANNGCILKIRIKNNTGMSAGSVEF